MRSPGRSGRHGSLRRGGDSYVRTSSIGFMGTYSGAAMAPEATEWRARLRSRVEEGVHDGVEERLPARLDDVLGDADRRPGAVAVGGVQQHAGHRARPLRRVEDADLVVGQV